MQKIWYSNLHFFPETSFSEQQESLADVKVLVNRLSENLTVSDHQLEQERKIMEKIEKIQFEVEPLEKLIDEIARQSQSRTTRLDRSWSHGRTIRCATSSQVVGVFMGHRGASNILRNLR